MGIIVRVVNFHQIKYCTKEILGHQRSELACKWKSNAHTCDSFSISLEIILGNYPPIEL